MDINKYLKVFDSFSYNNKLYGIGTAHLITGRFLVKENKFLPFGMRRIDGRTSLIYWKGTFTGGSSGFDFVAALSKELGINIYSIDEITDAALIGTDKKVIDMDGNEEHEAVDGILGNENIDVIYVDEGSMLFMKNPPPHQAKLRNFIQKALNPIGSETSMIRKKLAHTEISIYPTQSIYVVSFYPSTVNGEIISTGFLQRPLTIANFNTINHRIKNIYRDIDNLGIISDKTLYNEIINDMKDVQQFIQQTEEFSIDMSIKEQLKSYADDMKDIVIGTPSILQEDAGSFISAYQRHLSVIAWHHACWRFSTVIEKEDVSYAYQTVVRPIFLDLVSWLEGKAEVLSASRTEVRQDNELKDIFNTLIKNSKLGGEFKGYIGLTQFAEAVSKHYKKSPQSAYRYIQAFIKNGHAVEKQSGRSKFIKVK